MKPNWGVEVNPLPYMDAVTAPVLADFFSSRVTEYSTNLNGSWEDLR